MSRYVGQAVCVRYPGGAVYIGQLVEATPTDMVLEHPVWVLDTGQLGAFFRGKYDDDCTWQTMADTVEIPRAHAEISPWPNELPTESRSQ